MQDKREYGKNDKDRVYSCEANCECEATPPKERLREQDDWRSRNLGISSSRASRRAKIMGYEFIFFQSAEGNN
jgi:hypothetical protein